MSYRFIEDEATADIAFEARGGGLGETLRDAAEALLAVMVENPEDVRPEVMRNIELESDSADILLHDLLQELVYLKDAEGLLLRLGEPTAEGDSGVWKLRTTAAGEKLDTSRHRHLTDVKAVTLHDLRLEREGDGWRAHAVLDI